LIYHHFWSTTIYFIYHLTYAIAATSLLFCHVQTILLEQLISSLLASYYSALQRTTTKFIVLSGVQTRIFHRSTHWAIVE
jgi:hypothetical protein